MQTGLPNIIGKISSIVGSNTVGDIATSASAAFKQTYTDGRYTADAQNSGWWDTGYLVFSAADSNPIYGLSSTVQPNSIMAQYLIKY